MHLFKTKSTWLLLLLALLGAVNAVWTGSLLLIINNKISGTALPYIAGYSELIYVVLIVVSFFFKYSFESYMLRMNFNYSKEILLNLLDRLRKASYQAYQEIREERVRTAIDDVNTLESFPGIFLASFNAAIMIVIAAIYLFWLNYIMAFVIIVVLLLLIFVFVKQNRLITDDIEASRSLEDIYMMNLNDLLRGFREVKMSSRRSDTLYKNHLTQNRNRFVTLRINAFIRDLIYRLSGEYIFYIVMGVIVFYIPLSVIMNKETANAFVITILFMIGPINTFVSLINNYTRYNVALKRINTLNELIEKDTVVPIPTDNSLIAAGHSFHQIVFKNVSYAYPPENDSASFTLLPVNLTINRGDVIFISGGNGSGKSTFINLLTGIYSPGSGALYFNDVKVTENNIQQYRDRLSCIFIDGHLFHENYDEFDLKNTNKALIHLLEMMQLTTKVDFDNGHNRLSHNLSKGQSKRLAMIYTLLENKDMIVLDEWAAEQDPAFRKYFYMQIIPYLKAMGKTIVAITHDDQYFSCADRLIRFEYGEMVSDRLIAEYAV